MVLSGSNNIPTNIQTNKQINKFKNVISHSTSLVDIKMTKITAAVATKTIVTTNYNKPSERPRPSAWVIPCPLATRVIISVTILKIMLGLALSWATRAGFRIVMMTIPLSYFLPLSAARFGGEIHSNDPVDSQAWLNPVIAVPAAHSHPGWGSVALANLCT